MVLNLLPLLRPGTNFWYLRQNLYNLDFRDDLLDPSQQFICLPIVPSPIFMLKPSLKVHHKFLCSILVYHSHTSIFLQRSVLGPREAVNLQTTFFYSYSSSFFSFYSIYMSILTLFRRSLHPLFGPFTL